MFPPLFKYEHELIAYDTFDKLQILAQSMDVDVHKYFQGHYDLLDYYKRKPSPDNLTVEELEWSTMDMVKSVIYHEIEVRRQKRKLEKLIHGDTGNKSWFVTIGLDDKQFNEDNEAFIINPLVKKICLTPGFEDVKFVVEKFRKNESGNVYIHRHIHFVFDSNLRKSKIIQFCFQKAKKYIAGQNFIDVKSDPGRARDKYVKGDKIQTKMECVEKDRSWRKEKKIIEYE